MRASCSIAAADTPECLTLYKGMAIKGNRKEKKMFDLFNGWSFSLDSAKDCSFVCLFIGTGYIFRLQPAGLCAARVSFRMQQFYLNQKLSHRVLRKSSFASTKCTQSKSHVMQCVPLPPSRVSGAPPMWKQWSNCSLPRSRNCVKLSCTLLAGCIWWAFATCDIVCCSRLPDGENPVPFCLVMRQNGRKTPADASLKRALPKKRFGYTLIWRLKSCTGRYLLLVLPIGNAVKYRMQKFLYLHFQ